MNTNIIHKNNGDIEYELIDEKNQKLRSILFSREMQDDLDANIHPNVEERCNAELLSNSNGPNMKVSPVSTGHGASRTDFKLTPI